MAGDFARLCSAHHLILTHFSLRYIWRELDNGTLDQSVLRPHLEQAKEAVGHERVYTAQDLAVFHVAPHGTPAQKKNETSRPSVQASPNEAAPLHIAMPKRRVAPHTAAPAAGKPHSSHK